MAGSFLNAQLDPLITKGARCTILWSRTKIYTESGKLTQRFNWSKSKHEMNLSYRARPKSDYQLLLDFFYVVFGGAYIGFRVKDWTDFQLTRANSTLTFITGTTWQLQRKHTVASLTILRDIKKPVSASVLIYRTRSAVETLATASIDYTTGIVTVTGHVAGDTYAATGEFDVPMTFANDSWVTSLEVSTDNLWLAPEPILLEEVPL